MHLSGTYRGAESNNPTDAVGTRGSESRPIEAPSFTQVYVGSDLQFGALLSISTITSHRVDMGNISELSKIHFELLVKTLCTKVATVKTLVLLFLHAMLFVQPQRH